MAAHKAAGLSLQAHPHWDHRRFSGGNPPQKTPQVVFCFLTGNNDMHLKNFSIFKDPKKGYNLSPAYDMVAAELVVEGDDEELALTLNGKKKKIKRMDFEQAMGHFEIDKRAFENIFERFKKVLPKWHDFIDISFIPDKMKVQYHEMLFQKAKQIEL